MDLFSEPQKWWSQTGSNRRPLLAKQALSQLSYGPLIAIAGELIIGAEPKNWWAWEDLNFRPHAYQARALTN
jgi:hypothetical protein